MSYGLTELKDLIVLIPGILGSVLSKDGRVFWDSSLSTIISTAWTRGQSLSQLELIDPDIDDGVRAEGLIQGITLIPGLVKIDGYARIAQYMRGHFGLAAPETSGNPAGFVEFAYDWRRDNRHSAKLLQELVKDRLIEWRKFRKDDKAGVILLGHSMGGLIASYYLEVLGGWSHCKALITFGTPFHGSLRAVNYLVNGYSLSGVNLTEPLRSLPSVYQLLPDYKAIRCNDFFCRLDEANLPRVKAELLARGISFHKELQDANDRNQQSQDYLRDPYSVVSYVGTRQPTFQSAWFDKRELTARIELPNGMPADYADGDGVVPLFSAVHEKVRQDPAGLHSFVECHATLPSNDFLLNDLGGVIRQFEAGDHKQVLLGPGSIPKKWSGSRVAGRLVAVGGGSSWVLRDSRRAWYGRLSRQQRRRGGRIVAANDRDHDGPTATATATLVRTLAA